MVFICWCKRQVVFILTFGDLTNTCTCVHLHKLTLVVGNDLAILLEIFTFKAILMCFYYKCMVLSNPMIK